MRYLLKIIILGLYFILFGTILKSETENIKITPLIENAIKYNRLYVKKKKVKNSPWPEITIVTGIDATPEQSAAIFFAYDEHKEFIPDLLISKPIKYISPTELWISFEMYLPWPLKNSHFITNNVIKKTEKGGYKIEWTFVKSDSVKNSYGGVTFLPYKKKTMLIYRNYTLPKSGLAKIFKKSMFKKVKKTVISIRKRIETVLKTRQQKLPFYINNLHKALNGKYIYKNLRE